MPSPYSSSATQDDARALAAALGVRTHELPIEPVMDAYTDDAARPSSPGRDGRTSPRRTCRRGSAATC